MRLPWEALAGLQNGPAPGEPPGLAGEAPGPGGASTSHLPRVWVAADAIGQPLALLSQPLQQVLLGHQRALLLGPRR